MSNIKYVMVYGSGIGFKDYMAIKKLNVKVVACNSSTDTNDYSFNVPVIRDFAEFVCQGFYPETANGFEDNFYFVSLDVHLNAPTKAGCEYFYPRYVEQGVIFVDNNNNQRYRGVRFAVNEFCDHSRSPMLPIPDTAGSVFILK